MKIKSMKDLLVHEIKDLLSAEKQLLKALPKMAKAAEDPELREAFETHKRQTEGHVERLEQVFEQLGVPARAETCEAMEGLIEEGEETMELDAPSAVKDAALIGAAQKVEHYEIAGYGTARTFAQLIGERKVAELLQATLDEEGETDKLLTSIAEQINAEAEAVTD